MSINVGDGILYLKTDDTGIEQGLANLSRASGVMGKALTAAGVGIGAALGVAVKKAADFEQAIANAGSVTGQTGEALQIAKDKMEGLAKTLGQTTVFSASQAADAFYDLASRGFDVANMSLEELQPLLDLAAATQSDLSSATETATATLKAFKLENSDLGRVADTFVGIIGASAANMDRLKQSLVFAAPAAQSFGMGLEQTVAILGQLFDAGMEGSIAGTSLARMLSSLAVVSGPAEEALAALNLTLEDVNPETHKLADTLALMKDRGITTAQALEIFGERAGKSALALLDLQNEGHAATDAINEMQEELYGKTGAAASVAAEQLATLNGQMKLLASAVESVVLPVGKILLPKLTELASKAALVAQNLAVWIENNEDLTAKIIKITAGVGAFAAVMGPVLIMLPGIATGIKGIGLALSLLGGPVTILIAAVGLLGVAWQTNFMGIQEHTKAAIEKINELLGPWVAKFKEEIPAALDTLKEKFGPTFKSIEESFDSATKKIGEWKDSFLEGFNATSAKIAAWAPENEGRLSRFASALKRIIVPINKLIRDDLAGAMAKVNKDWDETYPEIQNSMDVFYEFMKINMEDFGDFVDEHSEGISIALETVWSSIKDIMKFHWDNAKTILQADLKLFQGDWEEAWGIVKTRFSEIWESIKTIATDSFNFLLKKIAPLIASINSLIGAANRLPLIDIPLIPQAAAGDGLGANASSVATQGSSQGISQTINQAVTINGSGLSENALKRAVGSAMLDLQRHGQLHRGSLL